jgi:hypothetical protein
MKKKAIYRENLKDKFNFSKNLSKKYFKAFS